MAKILFTSHDDVKRNTVLSGNLDPDKLVQYINIAQDIWIHGALGTDLYNRISEGIEADDLTADELVLLHDYIKPAGAHWTMVEYLPFAGFDISNQGSFRTTSENGQTTSESEDNRLLEKQRQTAKHYTDILIKYLCNNTDLFPTYLTNGTEDRKPTGSPQITSWYIPGKRKRYNCDEDLSC